MNNLDELVSHGINQSTARRMLNEYQARLGTMNGIYEIIDIDYDFDSKGRIVTLKCSGCGRVIQRTLIPKRNKWGELIKTCSYCGSEKRRIDSEKNKKLKKEQLLNQIGKVYGDYTVKDITYGTPDKLIMECTICGSRKSVSYSAIKNKTWKNNRCRKHLTPNIKYDSSYIGKRYGRLKVIEVHSNIRKKFECKCDCGKIIFVRPIELEMGCVKSCGCLKKEISENAVHGDRLYCVWQDMKSRCYYEKSKSYSNYGGRGIEICDEWLNDYKNFRDWAYRNGYDENAPRGECTIDRIDVNGNYEPNNCRWISNLEQQRNKRPSSEWKKRTKKRTSFLIYNGEKISKYELCKQHGISQEAFNYRIKEKNMSIEDALKTPKITSGRPKKEPVIF